MKNQKTPKNFKKALPVLTVMAGFTWSWLFLIDAARLSNSVLVGYGLIAFVFLLITSISTVIAFSAWKFIHQLLNKPSWLSLMKILLIWAAAELFIAWAVSVIWMGRGGSWDNVLPFYSLTPFIMHTPLRFLSRLFGYYGTSAMIGTLLVILIAGKPWRRLAVIYLLAIIVINFSLLGMFRHPNGNEIKVMITAEELGHPQKIETKDAQLVIFPEYGLDNIDFSNISERIKKSEEKEIYFSGTQQSVEDSKSHNILIFGSTTKGYVANHEKSRLIVGGEYLSYPVEELLKVFQPSVYRMFQSQRAVERGTGFLFPFELPSGDKLGNAACSSIINTEDYRKLTASGSTILANSASLEIFKGSKLFEIYHSGFAKFMATANSRPFLQSANNWQAFAIDNNGEKLSTVEPVGSKILNIYTNNRKTPYTFAGEWLAYIGIFFIFTIHLAKFTKTHLNPDMYPSNKSRR